MNNKQIYKLDSSEWPRHLSYEEQTKLLKAAADGDNPRRDTIITATMLYLGMSAADAAEVRFYTVNGDAIEDKKGRAFLHIPLEYRHIISAAFDNLDGVKITDRLTDCSTKEAEEAIKQVFARAGINADNYTLRLRRTAAALHYKNGWTWEGDILRWFDETEYINAGNEFLFYMPAISKWAGIAPRSDAEEVRTFKEGEEEKRKQQAEYEKIKAERDGARYQQLKAQRAAGVLPDSKEEKKKIKAAYDRARYQQLKAQRAEDAETDEELKRQKAAYDRARYQRKKAERAAETGKEQ